MWLVFSLIFALISTISVLVAKKVTKKSDEYSYLWYTELISLPILFFIVIFFYEIPKVDVTFWFSSAVSVILGVIAAVFAYRAIKISEVSLIAPIAAFNPIFTLIISFMILGEEVSIRGILGIILICIGAYFLQTSKNQKNFLEPIKLFFSNKGIILSFMAYFIWAFTPIFQKLAILHSFPQVPPYSAFIGKLGMSLLMTALVFKYSSNKMNVLKENFHLLLIVGILSGIGQTLAFVAFSLSQLGIVTAVFKLEIFFTTILGGLLFKEHNFNFRILSSLTMLGGILLIAT